MRIISGKARGTKLYTLDGNNTRPTLDRVKESIFNIIQNEIYDSVFLDLFAGSGAIGLEAASRGASKVIMCEKSREAVNIIKKNIEKTHLSQKVKLYELDYERFLLNSLEEKLDIIYIDPPYKTDYAIRTIKILVQKQLLKPETLIIIETDMEREIINNLEEIKEIEVKNIKKYGRATCIFLYQKA